MAESDKDQKCERYMWAISRIPVNSISRGNQNIIIFIAIGLVFANNHPLIILPPCIVTNSFTNGTNFIPFDVPFN